MQVCQPLRSTSQHPLPSLGLGEQGMEFLKMGTVIRFGTDRLRSELPAHCSGQVIRCISLNLLLGLTPSFRINEERIWDWLAGFMVLVPPSPPLRGNLTFNDWYNTGEKRNMPIAHWQPRTANSGKCSWVFLVRTQTVNTWGFVGCWSQLHILLKRKQTFSEGKNPSLAYCMD